MPQMTSCPSCLLRVLLLLALGASVVGFATAGLGAPEPARSLRILPDRPMPPALGKAVDIRWASDSSVYLAMLREGAVEASVDLDHLRVTKMIPKMMEPGGSFAHLLAASSEYLVTGGPLWVTWRTIANPTRVEEAFDSIHDFDVMKDQFLIVAARRGEKGEYAPTGALAWIGSLRLGLSDPRPVAYDATGPGARNLGGCSTFQMGGARFLRDGSFVIVPGVQPGIHLYSPEGKLLRAWDSALVGLDADCGSLTMEQILQYSAKFLPRIAWLNQRRTLDEILPLPQGPGLVVRSVDQGQTRWDLKVLTKKDAITAYQIPVQSQSERSHLKGDIRGDRIVFVMSSIEKDGMGSAVPRLIIAEAPK